MKTQRTDNTWASTTSSPSTPHEVTDQQFNFNTKQSSTNSDETPALDKLANNTM